MNISEGHYFAFLALLLLAIMQLVLSFMVGTAKGKAGIAPGAIPEGALESDDYRLHRTHINSVENLTPITITVVLGAIIGASALVMSIGAWLYLICRVIYNVIYVRNVKLGPGALRSMVFGGAWAINILLAIFVGISLI